MKRIKNNISLIALILLLIPSVVMGQRNLIKFSTPNGTSYYGNEFQVPDSTLSSLGNRKIQFNPSNPSGQLSPYIAEKCVATWIGRTSATDNNWRWVCRAEPLGLFVAVSETGTGDRIMTSSDGVAWTSRTSPANNEWFGVTWADSLGLILSVAETGSLNGAMSSPDGIAWTIRATPSNNEWRGIAWSNELDIGVAVANSGSDPNRAMSTIDGVNWVARASQPVGNGWTGVCCSPSLRRFCAVGNSGSGNRVMTSDNGQIWTERIPASAIGWVAVDWSEPRHLFCAVAADAGTANCVQTSPDGVTWTIQTAINSGWVTITWADALHMFIVASYNGQLMTSPDGKTWTTRSNPTGGGFRGLCFAEDLGIACAVAYTGTGNRVVTSTPPAKYYASGSYTPVLTNVINLDATTAYPAQWQRAGNVVTVSGIISVDPTSAAATEVGLSLPIFSNLTANYQCCGISACPAIAGQSAAIVGDTANDRSSMQWIAVDVTNKLMGYEYTYSIF